MSQTKIETAYKTEPQVRVLSKLPYQSSVEEFSSKAISEVLAEDGVKWLEMPLITEEIAHHYKTTPEQFEEAFYTEFADYLNNQQAVVDSLVLAEMGEYGKGLFAFQDITKGTILGVYTGNIVPANESSDYAVGMIAENFISQHSVKTALKNNDLLSVDASKHGNLMRYMQHLVDKRNSEYHFTDAINAIQTANVSLQVKLIANVPVFYAVTTDKINKNSLVGFDYTLNYWKAKKKQPAFFDFRGEVIRDCIPYKEWHPTILKIGFMVTEYLYSSKSRNNDHFLELLMRATNELISEDKKIITEFEKFRVGDESLLSVLKALFKELPESIIQKDIQDKIFLLVPKNSTNTTPAIKILAQSSALYTFYKEVRPNIVRNLDHLRRQIFGNLSANDEFKLWLQTITSTAEWKFKLQGNKYTFWCVGGKQKMNAVDKALSECHIEHKTGQIKDKEEFSIQIERSFN